MASNLFAEMLAPKLTLPERPEVVEGPACPKCRWTGKDPEVGWKKYVWVDPASAQRFNLQDENGNALGECLMVSCERCNYRWREPVANPEPVEEPS